MRREVRREEAWTRSLTIHFTTLFTLPFTALFTLLVPPSNVAYR